MGYPAGTDQNTRTILRVISDASMTHHIDFSILLLNPTNSYRCDQIKSGSQFRPLLVEP